MTLETIVLAICFTIYFTLKLVLEYKDTKAARADYYKHKSDEDPADFWKRSDN